MTLAADAYRDRMRDENQTIRHRPPMRRLRAASPAANCERRQGHKAMATSASVLASRRCRRSILTLACTLVYHCL